MMHFIGATKPDTIGKLRLNQNEIKLVFGLRSSIGDVKAFGQKIISGEPLTPEQRNDYVSTMKLIADRAAAKAGGGNPASSTQQGGGEYKGYDIKALAAKHFNGNEDEARKFIDSKVK